MPLVKEIIKFTIESLVFQNRLLNGAHSIWDIKLPWYHLNLIQAFDPIWQWYLLNKVTIVTNYLLFFVKFLVTILTFFKNLMIFWQFYNSVSSIFIFFLNLRESSTRIKSKLEQIIQNWNKNYRTVIPLYAIPNSSHHNYNAVPHRQEFQ